MTPQAFAMLAVLALGIGLHIYEGRRALKKNAGALRTQAPACRSAETPATPGRPAPFSVIEGGRH